MAKLSLTLAAAAFVLFFVATEATVRTTVIIDEEDASNQGGRRGGRDCGQQIQEQDNLRMCQEYMMEQMRGGGHRGGVNRPDREDCCNQLRKLDTECTCQGLEMAMSQMMKQMPGQMEMEAMETMWRMTENLPGRCNTSPSTCHFTGGRQLPAWF